MEDSARAPWGRVGSSSLRHQGQTEWPPNGSGVSAAGAQEDADPELLAMRHTIVRTRGADLLALLEAEGLVSGELDDDDDGDDGAGDDEGAGDCDAGALATLGGLA